jgi:cyclic 2,3-diphosphoglycerate synthase
LSDQSPAEKPTAIALIDGEHYPDVTRDALRFLQESKGYRLVALVFLGGTEKLAAFDPTMFGGLPVYHGAGQVADLRRAIAENPAQAVFDLSDEPVVGYRERFRLVSEALALGLIYNGADFSFKPPGSPYLCAKPSIGVWGSGKRVGKTAVSGHLARHLASKGQKPWVCTMGRGGPVEPELILKPEEVTDEYLRRKVVEGCHAASDHFEDAMIGSVPAVGCRRCGSGLAGEPFYSNVAQGAEIACRQEADIVIFEGSGAAIPPVGVDSVMLVASAAQPLEYLLGYLGPYRLLRSDLVVVTMCEEFQVSSEKLRNLIDGVLSINPEVKVVKTVFRPRPLGDLSERKAFLVSTAPEGALQVQVEHLEEEYGARMVGSSSNLADRGKLAADLERAGDADVMVTELKAAGVDTVSVFAKRNGKELVYLENLPVALEGDLEEEMDQLAGTARVNFLARQSPAEE